MFDGYVWSDIYEVGFTAHVIQTDEQKRVTKLYMLEDDPVMESGGLMPVAVKPDDYEVVKLGKRIWDGGYIMAKKAGGYISSMVPL